MPETQTRGLDLQDEVARILNRRAAVGLAVGVVRNGALEAFHAHGLADIATHTPVTADTVFRVASITKTFTAIAVMQLWEHGLLDLDAPAERYLRAYRLVPADSRWRPATVRHLLTHTAGLGEVVPASGVFRHDWGESVPAGQRVPSLAEHYRGALPVQAEPGTRFRYGNHGPATLGQIVEDVSGEPLDRYLRENVFGPLGMADTDVSRSEVVRSRIATGYRLGARGPKAVELRDLATVGAASGYSTPRDMARYVAALLGGGRNEHGAVLQPATLASMFAPQYQPDPRIPGLGLAFFRVEAGGRPVVEHQGILPGFDSQILAAHEDGVGVIAFTNGATQGSFWLPVEMGRLLHALLGVPEAVVRTDVPQRPEVWGDLCGWYYLPGPITDVRLRAAMGAGLEVFVRGGRLMVRAMTPVPQLYKGYELHPDDPDDPTTFRMDFAAGLGSTRVVFSRDPDAVHLGLMPVSAYRQPPASNPRLWTEAALAVAGTSMVRRRLRRGRRRRRR